MHQAIEIGSETKGGEAGLEDPWESRGSMARASLSQCWEQGRENRLTATMDQQGHEESCQPELLPEERALKSASLCCCLCHRLSRVFLLHSLSDAQKKK